MTSTGLDQHIGNVGWLVASFVEGTADVADAIVVSSDGLLLPPTSSGRASAR